MKSIPQAIQLALPFDGKACSDCREWKPLAEYHRSKHTKDGLTYSCKHCNSARANAWGHANRERNRERKLRWRNANRERIKRVNRAWDQANRDKVIQFKAEWREKHRDALAERRRQWRREHPEQRQADRNNRRARLIQAGGQITAQEWRDLKAFYSHKCLACGRSEPEIKLTLDHVIPLADGGTHTIANVQPLCWGCNARKRATTVDYRPQHPSPR